MAASAVGQIGGGSNGSGDGSDSNDSRNGSGGSSTNLKEGRKETYKVKKGLWQTMYCIIN